MKTGASLKNRQGGAVAVVVGISIFLLVGFLAMVIDLGHLYIAKTELQNGADAAALSGAKQLNGTLLGVNDSINNGAVQWAIATAAKNNYDFSSKPIDITIADIWVGNCPEDSCMVAASSIATDAAAAGKTFLKVHTRNRDMIAYFAPIWNIFHVSTYGMAVAGRTKANITPIAMCAIDVRQCPCLDGEATPCGPANGLCGYEPGKSYHVAGVNPIGPGTPIWIDPVATSTANCDTTNTRDDRPYICKGEAYVSTTPGTDVYTNTGGSTGPLYAALDSRFGDYASAGKCDTTTAPPDTNIQEYAYQLFDDVHVTGANPYRRQNLPGQSTVTDWMSPAPDPSTLYPQTSLCTATGTDRYGANIYTCPWSQNGVYWAASRRDATVDTQGVTTNSNYPATGTPYAQTSGRRLINLLIVQCESAGGVCRPARNRIVGQFLQQTRASVSNDVNLEFVRTVSQGELAGEIKLFR